MSRSKQVCSKYTRTEKLVSQTGLPSARNPKLQGEGANINGLAATRQLFTGMHVEKIYLGLGRGGNRVREGIVMPGGGMPAGGIGGIGIPRQG